MIDFTHVIDFIFKNKEDYKKLSDEDKERTFFMVNRKLARRFPEHAKLLNTKDTDKSTALDIWYSYFIKIRANGIPDWYWFKQKTLKKKSFLSGEEREFFINYFDISEEDLDFLILHFKEDLEEEVKKYRKFNKKDE
jgi:hypothetical protein